MATVSPLVWVTGRVTKPDILGQACEVGDCIMRLLGWEAAWAHFTSFCCGGALLHCYIVSQAIANTLFTSESFIRLNFAFGLDTLMAKQDHVNIKALYTVYTIRSS